MCVAELWSRIGKSLPHCTLILFDELRGERVNCIGTEKKVGCHWIALFAEQMRFQNREDCEDTASPKTPMQWHTNKTFICDRPLLTFCGFAWFTFCRRA